jgi:hypothetical protein
MPPGAPNPHIGVPSVPDVGVPRTADVEMAPGFATTMEVLELAVTPEMARRMLPLNDRG